MSEVYEKVNEAFKETFRIIFGECNLNISDLEEYLWRYHYKPDRHKSSVSGKDVVITDTRYCKGAKIISQDEIDLKRRFELNINEIKDIDSILEAIEERMEYAGNKVFGSSKFYENTDNCNDSFYVYNSHEVDTCKYVSHSSYVRAGSEHIFGCAYFLRSKYLIKTMGSDNLTRGFESYFSANCSDLFFTYYTIGCSNVMFSFSQRAKNYVIGNLALPRDKYMDLRKKLVEESREYLEKHKTFPSIFEFPPPSKQLVESVKIPKRESPKTDFGRIEQAFAETSRIVLGKELSPMSRYEKFLSERVNRITPIKTVFGGDTVNVDFFFHRYIPRERAVNTMESMETMKLRLQFEDGEEVSLKSILGKLPGIAFYRIDMIEGESENNIQTPIVYHSVNTYKVCDATYNKNCAYCTFALALDGRRGESQF
ncbi:MAG: hypothetical protein PHS02_04085, partial [Candidatus ainarchaeum sp.]|nr:hypothetical protein [Candidatus ainarchaeum sp.]